MRKDYLKNQAVETVYFGGGTPSLLSERQLHFLMEKVRKLFPSDWKEVTLEANPDDLSEENLSMWKELGVDRLSLGIQSFQEEVLQFYNRAHTAIEAWRLLRKAEMPDSKSFRLI